MSVAAADLAVYEIAHDVWGPKGKVRTSTTFKLEGKYEPVKVLGSGAFGVVISAINKETGEKVAIKRIKPVCSDRTDGLHSLREIRMMRWLGRHPNIVTLKDVAVNLEDDELYIIMTLYDSDLHRINVSGQPLEDLHYKHFMFQLLRGLRFAHAYGIIHRDLKPANLLVTKACDLVISDFGLARQLDSEAAMTEHVVTRWYRAPELMLSADGHYDMAVDVWSVGCIFAELLLRRPIFNGNDFKETLQKQLAVLGSRPDDELEFIRSDEARKFLASLPRSAGTPWATLMPKASPKALDLLDKLLQFSSVKRIGVDDALAHPYFDSIRSQYESEVDPVLPVGPGGFEFSFEGDDTLDVPAFKRLLVEEAISFRAEKSLARHVSAARMGTAALVGSHHEHDGCEEGGHRGGAHGGAGAVPDAHHAPATVVKR